MPELKDKDVSNFEPVAVDYSKIAFKWAGYVTCKLHIGKVGRLNKNRELMWRFA